MYERLIAIQQQLVAAHAGRADEATLTLTLGRGAAGDARGAHEQQRAPLARRIPRHLPLLRAHSHTQEPTSLFVSPGACRPAAGAAAVPYN